MRLQLDAEDYAAIARELGPLVVEQLLPSLAGGASASPWMRTEEAIVHTRLPKGTFEKLAAAGVIPSHQAEPGARRRLFHRAEVDEALLGYRRRSSVTELRRAS